jgi:cytochrome c oxidase assembly factor CtaG
VGDTARLLMTWDPPPAPFLGCVWAVVGYWLGARHVSRSAPSQPWPAGRSACWYGGVLALLVAVGGPPGAWDEVYFYAHMTQHVLLVSVAAPLLVLGDPLLLLVRVARPGWRRRRLVPLLRSRTLGVLTHPVVGWCVLVGVLAGTHVPAVYDFALEHPLVHDYVEHPLYLAAGTVYFYPLLVRTGARHVPHGIRLVSLFTTMVPMAVLGFFIYALPRLAYPFYAHTDRPFGPGPLADQHSAGVVMWSGSMVLGALWLVVAGRAWMVADERRTDRAERRPAVVGDAGPGLGPEAAR